MFDIFHRQISYTPYHTFSLETQNKAKYFNQSHRNCDVDNFVNSRKREKSSQNNITWECHEKKLDQIEYCFRNGKANENRTLVTEKVLPSKQMNLLEWEKSHDQPLQICNFFVSNAAWYNNYPIFHDEIVGSGLYCK